MHELTFPDLSRLTAAEVFNNHLRNRNRFERFDHPYEQSLIAMAAGKMWQERGKISGRRLDLQIPVHGLFPDKKAPYIIDDQGVKPFDYGYLVGGVRSLGRLMAVSVMGERREQLGSRMTLAAPFFEFQRMERDVQKEIGVELSTLSYAMRDLARGFSRGLIHLENHSLGTEYRALEAGMPILSLTAIPLLLKRARERLSDLSLKSVAVAVVDSGAYSLGRLTQWLLGGDDVPLIVGDKTSKQRFNGNLAEVRGRMVFMPDDLVGSGGTIIGADQELTRAGAGDVMGLITHTPMEEGTEEKLSASGIKLIVGNSLSYRDTPGHRSRQARLIDNGFDVVDVVEPLRRAVEMDAEEALVDVFSNPGTQGLLYRKTGLMLAPLLDGRFRRPME